MLVENHEIAKDIDKPANINNNGAAAHTCIFIKGYNPLNISNTNEVHDYFHYTKLDEAEDVEL